MHLKRCTTGESEFGTRVSLTGAEYGWRHKEPCFHLTSRAVCTVALNRPATPNGNHINPPDISSDGNTNVYFGWGGENPKWQIKDSRRVGRPYLGWILTWISWLQMILKASFSLCLNIYYSVWFRRLDFRSASLARELF